MGLVDAQPAQRALQECVDEQQVHPLDGRGGQPVRALGYGLDALDGGTGTRHEVALTLRQISPEQILIGDLVSKGICRGDSGGPTLHTFDDGVERVIGVHSFTPIAGRQSFVLKTERQPTSVDWRGCTAEGQKEPQ